MQRIIMLSHKVQTIAFAFQSVFLFLHCTIFLIIIKRVPGCVRIICIAIYGIMPRKDYLPDDLNPFTNLTHPVG